jgi:sporulation protein YlmC with PRC-barrel domain
MYSQNRLSTIVGIATAVVVSTISFAQEPQLKPSTGLIGESPAKSEAAASTATTVKATAGATETVSPSSWLTREAVGDWRASRMVGLNVYNDDNEKIGSIAELIVDRSGKLEAVVVGAGGFLGIGERDVAVPYGQINWVFTPVGRGRSSTGAIPADTARSSSDRDSYPDHAVLNMTKDQLKAAPAFTYSH